MIVDDQMSARTMLRHVIEDIAPHLQVFDFGDPSEALAWCEVSQVDLLLLDYRIRRIWMVWNSLLRLHQLPNRRDIPILIDHHRR